LSIIYKKTEEEIKNLVVLIDGMDLIEYTGCILHIKLHMWQKFQNSIMCWWRDIEKTIFKKIHKKFSN
jgi:hypothetical protein